MADEGLIALVGSVSGAIGGAISMGFGKLVSYFKNRDDAKDRQVGEESLWGAVNKIKDEQSEHNENDARMFGKIEAQLEYLKLGQDRVLDELREIRKRTGKV